MVDSLRVGMLVDTYLPFIGGAEVHVLELSRALRAIGLTPMVCTATLSDNDQQHEEIPVTRIPALQYSGWSTWLRLPFAVPQLLRFIRRMDVVHCHYTFFMSMLGTVLGKLLGKRTVVTLHGLGTLDSSVGSSVMMQFFRRVSLRYAHKIIATSEEMRLLALRFVPAERIVLISNGVDTSRYISLPKSVSQEFVILTMRRLVPKNGVQYLVEAAPAVIAALPQACFWVAGQGKLEDYIHQRVAELGVESNFRFIGLVPHTQTADYYQQAELVVFPSSAESTSLACLEAMSMEKAIVASNLEAYQEMLGDQQRGLLVKLFDRTESDYNAPLTLPPERIQALAEAIIKLATNPALRSRLGSQARRYVIEEYDWKRIADLTTQAYQD
ncbi:MAG: glycosyltransferase family 4 protein [Chloroflexota bacterium]